MKSLVFDTGPIISLAMNNLLWVMPSLKQKFGGEFYITEGVKRECVEKPLNSKKFKFEALQILRLIQDDVIKVYNNPTLRQSTDALLELSNSLFKVNDVYIRNVQYAEIESVSAAKISGAKAVVIDEFITRSLLENALSVRERMERKLHTNVEMDRVNVSRFKKEVSNVRVIRSVELVTVAYENNLFSDYYLNLPNPKRILLEGLLWALKLNGCSVTEQEIFEILKLEKL